MDEVSKLSSFRFSKQLLSETRWKFTVKLFKLKYFVGRSHWIWIFSQTRSTKVFVSVPAASERFHLTGFVNLWIRMETSALHACERTALWREEKELKFHEFEHRPPTIHLDPFVCTTTLKGCPRTEFAVRQLWLICMSKQESECTAREPNKVIYSGSTFLDFFFLTVSSHGWDSQNNSKLTWRSKAAVTTTSLWLNGTIMISQCDTARAGTAININLHQSECFLLLVSDKPH